MSKRPHSPSSDGLPSKVVVSPGNGSIHQSVDLKLNIAQQNNLLLKAQISELEKKIEGLSFDVTTRDLALANTQLKQKDLEMEAQSLRFKTQGLELTQTALNVELEALTAHTPNVIDRLHGDLDLLYRRWRGPPKSTDPQTGEDPAQASNQASEPEMAAEEKLMRDLRMYRERWLKCEKELAVLKRGGLPREVQVFVDQVKGSISKIPVSSSSEARSVATRAASNRSVLSAQRTLSAGLEQLSLSQNAADSPGASVSSRIRSTTTSSHTLISQPTKSPGPSGGPSQSSEPITPASTTHFPNINQASPVLPSDAPKAISPCPSDVGPPNATVGPSGPVVGPTDTEVEPTKTGGKDKASHSRSSNFFKAH
ncbi:hypothetical protein PM082_007165 [Marasmius tenuissimus]|nr:hypothetical protein PM082_007165 [Marasmius tenuissimus]